MRSKNIRSIHDIHLRDPEVASGYINEALASGDQAVILMAIRNIVEAQEGGFSGVAVRALLGRESMYKMLSISGNPKLSTLTALLHAIGLKFQVVPENKK